MLFVYFLKGSLPWESVNDPVKEKRCARVLKMKMETSLEVLCSGLPQAVRVFLEYCRNLRFEEQPGLLYFFPIKNFSCVLTDAD